MQPRVIPQELEDAQIVEIFDYFTNTFFPLPHRTCESQIRRADLISMKAYMIYSHETENWIHSTGHTLSDNYLRAIKNYNLRVLGVLREVRQSLESRQPDYNRIQTLLSTEIATPRGLPDPGRTKRIFAGIAMGLVIGAYIGLAFFAPIVYPAAMAKGLSALSGLSGYQLAWPSFLSAISFGIVGGKIGSVHKGDRIAIQDGSREVKILVNDCFGKSSLFGLRRNTELQLQQQESRHVRDRLVAL